MAVLVTGVGFIGGYVVRDLLAAGEDVVVYGFLGGDGTAGNLPELDYIDALIGGGVRDRVKVVVGDVGDLDAITRVAEQHGVTSIAHFASMLPASAAANPYAATRINVTGTANVFEVAARSAMAKVVWMSSLSVFGPRSVSAAGRVHDDSVPDPGFTYGAAKLMGEKLAVAYSDKFGLNITGVRPTRVYGFGEYVKLSRGGASSWLNNLLYVPAVGDEPSVVPFGDSFLNFLYVEDVSAGVLEALRYRDPQGASSYLFSGDHRRVAEAFAFVKKLLPDAKITLETDSVLAQGATPAFALDADSSRATEAFGFAPRHRMEAGVYRTLNGNRVHAGLPPIPEPAEARVEQGVHS